MLEQYTQFDLEDDVINQLDAKVTSGIFSSDTGILTTYYSSSAQTALSSSHYYFHVYDSPTTSSIMFDMSYGNNNSSTGLTYGDTYEETYKPDQAIYKQYANICLPTDENSFTFANSTTGSGEIFIINFSREQVRDGINNGNWQLDLTNGTTVNLIDNSNESSPSQPEVGINTGQAYYIGSGSSDTLVDTVANHPYGIVYPKLGVMVLNAKELAGDLSGLTLSTTDARTNIDYFYQAAEAGGNFVARDEEEISSTHYFCRIKNKNYNFSNNPTWQTGSAGLMKYTEMYRDPQTYITTIGLYNDSNELLATAKLSKPQLKNFERELLVKVKINY